MTSRPQTPINVPPPRTWDARLARRLVTPLVNTWVTPNHLTTLRLLIGLAGALCLAHGGFRVDQCRCSADRAVELRRPHGRRACAHRRQVQPHRSFLRPRMRRARHHHVVYRHGRRAVGAAGATHVGGLKVDAGRARRDCRRGDCADLFPAHAHRGNGGQGGHEAGIGRRLRNRRRVVPAAHRHTDERRACRSSWSPRLARRSLPRGSWSTTGACRAVPLVPSVAASSASETRQMWASE